MKYIFPWFFLLIMSLNVAIPLMEQLRGGDMYEYTELGAKELDGKDKSEKEEGKEKESYTFSDHSGLNPGAFYNKKRKNSGFPKADQLLSELYAFLPELPPEA
ncbi:MAG: hypothetical protein IPJ82_02445 [Lewinellaceae bacterium]|nr:hypothetical protein [Lewinellaceae bacterium]